MKWLSVKKYKPVLNSKVFVITQDGDIWTATYCYGFEEETPVFMCDMDNLPLHSTTHFCIPPVLEREE